MEDGEAAAPGPAPWDGQGAMAAAGRLPRAGRGGGRGGGAAGRTQMCHVKFGAFLEGEYMYVS